MNFSSIELLINLCFLGLSGYLYAYSSGILNIKDPSLRKRQTEVIKTSGKWMRPLTLALAAFSLINIIFLLFG